MASENDEAWCEFQGEWASPTHRLRISGQSVALRAVDRELVVLEAFLDGPMLGPELVLHVAADFDGRVQVGSVASEARRAAATAPGAQDVWRLQPNGPRCGALTGTLVDAAGNRVAQTLSRKTTTSANGDGDGAPNTARLRFRDRDGDEIEFRAPADPNGRLAEYVNGSLELSAVTRLEWHPQSSTLRDGSGVIPLSGHQTREVVAELEALVQLHASGTEWSVQRPSFSRDLMKERGANQNKMARMLLASSGR